MKIFLTQESIHREGERANKKSSRPQRSSKRTYTREETVFCTLSYFSNYLAIENIYICIYIYWKLVILYEHVYMLMFQLLYTYV